MQAANPAAHAHGLEWSRTCLSFPQPPVLFDQARHALWGSGASRLPGWIASQTAPSRFERQGRAGCTIEGQDHRLNNSASSRETRRRPMFIRPGCYGPEAASVFEETSVAQAYQYRPSYPHEVFDLLEGLLVDQPAHVLDVGCGT